MIQETHLIQECIRLCEACCQTCHETIEYWSDNEPLKDKHLLLLQDCVQICQTSFDFMTRSSTLSGAVCEACAKVCEQCAAECEAASEGNSQLQACSTICHSCATKCRAITVNAIDAQFNDDL